MLTPMLRVGRLRATCPMLRFRRVLTSGGHVQRSTPHLLTWLLALLLGLVVSSGMVRASCVDVALVLAIDASGSINDEEFALQQQGYAAAFRSPRLQSALAAAGTVDIGVVLWGDTEETPQILPVQRVRTQADAVALALRIATLRRDVHGTTGIGRGVSAALDLLDDPAVCATRRLINVSGDGKQSVLPRPRRHVPLATARARARELGVTINALAIETEVTNLAAWYRDNLITGPGAFVMKIDGIDSFADAIVEKLVREIGPAQVALVRTEDGSGPIGSLPPLPFPNSD